MSVKFTRVVADENVPREVVEILRGMGLKEVYWVAEHKKGIADTEVWRLAKGKQAVLITGDLRFLPQLDQNDILFGPDVIEYVTSGFAKSELRDPQLMQAVIGWFFQNSHHLGKEYSKISLDGKVNTRKQLWGQEKARRKRQP